jgi:hypothetical protein
MPSNSRIEGSNVLGDMSSNICQGLPMLNSVWYPLYTSMNPLV